MRCSLLLAFFSLLTVSRVPAGEAANGGTREFLQVIAGAPALAAATQRIEAARSRMEAAGQLPDPEVEAMGSRMNGPMGEEGSMWELSVRQPLPKRGERAADRDRAEALLAVSEAEYAAIVGDLAADAAIALAEADGAEARIRLLETQVNRLDAVLRLLQVQLSSGQGGRLADRLGVQTRIASMQLMIEHARRLAADARAGARGRLGLSPEEPLPAYAAPASGEIDGTRAAEIQLAAARAGEAGAQLRMAEASANPATAVGLRLEREQGANGHEDIIGLAFMSEIPWRSRRTARAEADAAKAERLAARIDATAAGHRIRSALTRVERAERLVDMARRLSDETLARLDAEYDTMIQAAGAGEGTLFQAVEVLDKATEAELQVLEADTAARVARAELWRYVAADQLFDVSQL